MFRSLLFVFQYARFYSTSNPRSASPSFDLVSIIWFSSMANHYPCFCLEAVLLKSCYCELLDPSYFKFSLFSRHSISTVHFLQKGLSAASWQILGGSESGTGEGGVLGHHVLVTLQEFPPFTIKIMKTKIIPQSITMEAIFQSFFSLTP